MIYIRDKEGVVPATNQKVIISPKVAMKSLKLKIPPGPRALRVVTWHNGFCG